MNNMQNEINTALHLQLRDEAQKIFQGLKITPGRYSAGDVVKFFELQIKVNLIAALRHEMRECPATIAENTIKVNSELDNLENVGFSREVITISYDTFRASMPAYMVFIKLQEWERTFKIKTSERGLFVREEESQVIGSCVVDFPKTSKFVADYVGSDPCFPSFMSVYLDLKNKCLAASDRLVLTHYPVEIQEVTDGLQELKGLLLSPKIVKSVAGQRCVLELCQNGKISVKDSKGNVYTCENESNKYADFMRVLAGCKVSRDGLTQLSKEGIKTLHNFSKSVEKECGKNAVGFDGIRITIPAYSGEGTATFEKEYIGKRSVTFSVVGAPRVNIDFVVSAKELNIILKSWSGCLWYVSPSRPLIFDTIDSDTLCMPLKPQEGTELTGEDITGEVPSLERHNYVVASERIKAEKQRQKEESASIPRELKEEYIQIIYGKDGKITLTETDEVFICEDGVITHYWGYFERKEDGEIFYRITNKEILTEMPDGVKKADSEIQEEPDYSELIEAISEIAEIAEMLGNIFEMIRHAMEIETLAASAGIELESPPASEMPEIVPAEAPTIIVEKTEPIKSPPAPDMVNYIVVVDKRPETARKRPDRYLDQSPTMGSRGELSESVEKISDADNLSKCREESPPGISGIEIDVGNRNRIMGITEIVESSKIANYDWNYCLGPSGYVYRNLYNARIFHSLCHFGGVRGSPDVDWICSN